MDFTLRCFRIFPITAGSSTQEMILTRPFHKFRIRQEGLNSRGGWQRIGDSTPIIKIGKDYLTLDWVFHQKDVDVSDSRAIPLRILINKALNHGLFNYHV
jgi:hypothetical protein